MSGKRKSKEPRPPLRREDLHEHPQQGTQPYRGPPHHHHPDESRPWQPYVSIPMIMHPPGAVASGFTTGDTHMPGPFRGVGPRNYAKTDQRVLDDVCEPLATPRSHYLS